MKFSYDLYGGPQHVKEIQVVGSTISKGALLIRGATSGTDFGMAKVAVSPLTDAIGVVEEPVLSTQTASVQSTGVVLLHKVTINPFAVYRCGYSLATADTLTGVTSSGTVVTISSLEDLTGGFIYVISGQAAGQLQYVISASGNTANTLTAFNPVIASGDYIVKIHANFSKLVDLTTDGTKIGGTGGAQAAAGTGVVSILDTYIQADTIPRQKLRPDLHSGITGLNTKNPVFDCDITFTKHLLTHQS